MGLSSRSWVLSSERTFGEPILRVSGRDVTVDRGWQSLRSIDYLKEGIFGTRSDKRKQPGKPVPIGSERTCVDDVAKNGRLAQLQSFPSEGGESLCSRDLNWRCAGTLQFTSVESALLLTARCQRHISIAASMSSRQGRPLSTVHFPPLHLSPCLLSLRCERR